jgi:serpin B
MNPINNPPRFKAIIAVLLVSFLFSAPATAGTNIALNKPAFADSYYLDSDPGKAVDGDTSTAWNSGRWHPAWLGIDLSGKCAIDSINVKLAQTPAGATAFQAWTYCKDDSMMAAQWNGPTQDGSWFRKGFDTPLQNVESIRICSESSPSWISFYEVTVIGTITKRKQPAESKHSFSLSNVQSLADSNECFALDLYKKVSADKGNVILSPYSVSIALAMTYGGARSSTEKEMAKTLHFADNFSVHASFLKTRQSLDSLNNGKNQLLIANALWPQKDYRFLPAYFDMLKTQYGVSVSYVDYVNAAEPARKTINAWTSDNTKGKIVELIGQGSLDSDTRLVLTNAIYLKAAWEFPFDRNRTEESDFFLLSGDTIRTAYMKRTKKFRYAETEEMKVLEMPYSGRQLSMIILLPKKNDLSLIESGLSPAKLHAIINSLVEWKVVVALPKFKMDHMFSFNGTLSSMGMPSAFSPKADFSGMDGSRQLFISDVIHKAFIEVDEEGTVAAAATAVMVTKMCLTIEPEPKEFIADHPFLFIIRHNPTGTILFMGRLTKPT